MINDGLIQSEDVSLNFDDVFAASATGFNGILNVDFLEASEPYITFDYAELSTQPINKVPEPASIIGLLAVGAIGVGSLLKRKTAVS